MAITSTTARADLFKEVYALLNGSLATAGVTVADAFSDDIADSLQIVINAPIMPRKKLGFEVYDRSGSIELEVYGPKMQSVVELHDDIENTIFSNLTSLSVQNVELGESSPAQIESGGNYVHVIVIPISFHFIR